MRSPRRPGLSALLLILFAGAAARAAAVPSDEDSAAAARVLDDWHDAAAKADEARYFGHFAKAGVFLGTDAKERWTASEFRAWARPFFTRGKAWTFTPKSRHLTLSADRATAWFDELLDTQNMGLCRGSGVLVKEGGVFKVALYDLSVPIPNELVKEFVARIAASEKGVVAPPGDRKITP